MSLMTPPSASKNSLLSLGRESIALLNSSGEKPRKYMRMGEIRSRKVPVVMYEWRVPV